MVIAMQHLNFAVFIIGMCIVPIYMPSHRRLLRTSMTPLNWQYASEISEATVLHENSTFAGTTK